MSDARLKFGIGQPARRVEDTRFLLGEGRFTADHKEEGALHAAFLRSPHAHARFVFSNLEDARALAGVYAVYTIEDVRHLGNIKCLWPVPNADGSLTPPKPYPILADGEAFHVGDIIAMVVADSEETAGDGLEAINVGWKPLEAVSSMPEALADGAVQLFAGAPGNLAYDNHFGDKNATDTVFARAAHVVGLTVVNNRVAANYVETRGAIAAYSADDETFLLRVTSQGVHPLRDLIAENILHIGKDKIRVVTQDVGGGFGTKTLLYREYPLLLEAARRLGRPVRWIGDRTEHFTGDAHGRDNLTRAEMALDADGRFLAMRLDILGNLGGYPSQTGPYVAYVGASMASGPYDIGDIHVRVRGVYTHTTPVDAYRGAGNPEATYVLERLVDRCAQQLAMSSDEIRRRNFVAADRMPYKTPTGRTYDVGDFAGTLAEVLRRADHAGFDARLAASRSRGRLRGFGLASYVECTAWGAGEEGTLNLEPDGTFTLLVGTQSTGQGHETAYAQVAAARFDVPLTQISVVQGDTNRVRSGWGTGGSRSIPVGAVMVGRASDKLVAVIKAVAADALEASFDDLEIADGGVGVIGTDKRLSFAELAREAAIRDIPLSASDEFTPPDATYPNGTHCCEVELDPETGAVSIERYHVVDDFGVTLNPLLLDGQIHGGIAQGAGQALSEAIVYDAQGQLLTGSLMDYGLPRADNFPFFDIATRNIPSTTNPMGLKGAGEAGSVGASPAIINAISDAIWRAYGAHDIDMPATPFAVFKAIQDASRRLNQK
jgi:carbon-monoxide dehydrogenase large subunit